MARVASALREVCVVVCVCVWGGASKRCTPAHLHAAMCRVPPSAHRAADIVPQEAEKYSAEIRKSASVAIAYADMEDPRENDVEHMKVRSARVVADALCTHECGFAALWGPCTRKPLPGMV